MILANVGDLERQMRRKYVGVPYVNRGRDLRIGLDCWGMLLSGYADLGIILYDIDVLYAEDWHKQGGNYLIDNWHHDWVRIAPAQARFPDGVLFSTAEGIGTHAGIVLSGGEFLHAHRALGVVASRLGEPPWNDRVWSFFRHKSLA